MGDDSLARLAARLSDRYRFLFKVGQGGWGSVFEVLNLQLDRREALKVVTTDAVDRQRPQRFAHEARIAAALDHSRIVKIYAFGEEEGTNWYSMQLIDGPTLGDLIEAGWKFDEAMLARLAMPLMDALDYSHGRGVVHRDIKPANILFNAEGRPYLTDFGIAKTRESVMETLAGQLLGTPAFISPEQALGEPVDARADQYSFAITLYKALSGVLPFDAEGQIQTLMQRVRQEPDPIWTHRPDLSSSFSTVIMRALSRDREQRWASMADMRKALLEACAEESIEWNLPVAGLAGFPLTREPVAPDLTEGFRAGEGGSAYQNLDPTADLRSRATRPPRRWPWGLAFAGLAGLAWLAFRPPAAPAAPAPLADAGRSAAPAQAKESTPAPAAPGPGSKKEALPPSTPAELPPIRRVAVYPQLIEGGALPAGIPVSCLGAKVNLSLLIGEDGLVKACKVVSKNVSPECAEAARAAAMRYRYKPGLDAEGSPVECTAVAAVDFPENP
jgi:serine/threonine-protein kinase